MPFPTRYGNNKSRKSYRAPTRPDFSGIKNAAKAADKAGSGFFRWMTTDHAHTETFLLLIDKPTSGFWAHIGYIIKCFCVAIGVSVARTLLIIILYLIWIPFVLWLLFWILTH